MAASGRSGPQKIVTGLAGLVFSVPDPAAATADLAHMLGLEGGAGPEVEPLILDGARLEFRALQGPSWEGRVQEIGFTSSDCVQSWELATARGAASLHGPREDPDGTLVARIETHGGLTHAFVEREPARGSWRIELEADPAHVEDWAAYYRFIFNFEQVPEARSVLLDAAPELHIELLPASAERRGEGPRGALSVTGMAATGLEELPAAERVPTTGVWLRRLIR